MIRTCLPDVSLYSMGKSPVGTNDCPEGWIAGSQLVWPVVLITLVSTVPATQAEAQEGQMLCSVPVIPALGYRYWRLAGACWPASLPTLLSELQTGEWEPPATPRVDPSLHKPWQSITIGSFNVTQNAELTRRKHKLILKSTMSDWEPGRQT